VPPSADGTRQSSIPPVSLSETNPDPHVNNSIPTRMRRAAAALSAVVAATGLSGQTPAAKEETIVLKPFSVTAEKSVG
jgi:hypothetical protein